MKREDLVRALNIVHPGLANKEVIEGTTSFAFVDDCVITYNDEISVRHTVEGLKLTGAIKATEFYKLLGKLKQEEIKVETTGNEVVLSSGRSKAGFTLQEEIKLPLDQIGEKSKWATLPENFTTALNFCMLTCSRDMSRPALTCINIRSDGRLESSDNFRISCYNVGKINIQTILLPATAAQTLVKYKLVKVAEGEGWLHFKTDLGTEFSCRTYQEEFPSVIDKLKVDGKEIEFPESIVDVLDRAAVFCGQDQIIDQRVTVSVVEKKLGIKVQGDSGWFEEEKNMAYNGKPFTFVINPFLLKTILAQTRKCIIGDRCMKFSEKDWQYIVALME
jgi:DNA polymerase III sliding clamp (beta) subunit (PCNA family)